MSTLNENRAGLSLSKNYPRAFIRDILKRGAFVSLKVVCEADGKLKKSEIRDLQERLKKR